MKRIVIDASVVLKWYLSDEKYGQLALEILDKYVSYELELLAPSLLEYEVLNGLHVARKRGRIQIKMVWTAIEGFLNLEIEQKDISFFYPEAINFSANYSLSTFDSSYLAVADIENIPMITADVTLYNRVKKDLKWVKWLGNFTVYSG